MTSPGELEDSAREYITTNQGLRIKAAALKLESLRLPAVIPPPEEEKDVKTAIGAAALSRPGKRCCNRASGGFNPSLRARSEIWLDIIFFTSSVLWSLYFLFSDIWAYGSSHPLGYLLARKYEVAAEAATG
jgi:hypothetical protein